MQHLGLRVYLMACAMLIYSLRARYRESRDERAREDR